MRAEVTEYGRIILKSESDAEDFVLRQFWARKARVGDLRSKISDGEHSHKSLELIMLEVGQND